MREFDRINRILNLIQTIWMKYPDLRLNQLLGIVLIDSKTDYFYIEDNFLEEKLLEYLENQCENKPC